MTNLQNYLNGGANYQAQAVLAFLKHITIEDSWNPDTRKYDAEFNVGRWENHREQGYIISLKSKYYQRQLNIAFFEHRNSDNICAVKWEQLAIDTITIDNAKFGEGIYTDKYDVSKYVNYGQIVEMAVWIENQFQNFWNETK